MNSIVLSKVVSGKRGVIVIEFTAYDGWGTPLSASRQPLGRYQVVDVNGPPVVRFTGQSLDEAWGFVDESEHFYEVADSDVSKKYISKAFARVSAVKVEGIATTLGKITAIKRDGTERGFEFKNSHVAAVLGGTTSDPQDLTILFGEKSREDLFEALHPTVEDVLPDVARVPKPPGQ